MPSETNLKPLAKRLVAAGLAEHDAHLTAHTDYVDHREAFAYGYATGYAAAIGAAGPIAEPESKPEPEPADPDANDEPSHGYWSAGDHS